jgi:surface antigen
MRSIILALAIPLVGASLSSGCATPSGTGLATGATGGAVVGGIVGGGTGAMAGAILGGALGYGVGRYMEEEDKRRMAYAMEQNQRMQWENQQTGAEYQIAPTGTFYRGNTECRNFRMMAEVDGRPDEITGVACRNPDGTWNMQG